MTQSFFIPGILPNLNDMLAAARKSRGKWQAFADMKVSHEQYIALCIKKAKLTPMQRVNVTFHWYEPSTRRDKDNIRAAGKFVLDSLVACKIIPTDGWLHVGELKDVFDVTDRKHCGVEITLEEAV